MTQNEQPSSPVRLEVGQVAPAFTGDTTSGQVTLAQLVDEAARGVIVYFYPKAGTPGCTKEACDFRDSLASLESAGYRVIGISPDSLAALERFEEKQQLNFLLASDPNHEIMTEWGVWGTKKAYGRTFLGVTRSTFVVGKDGDLEVVQYNVKATGHVARLRKALGLD